MIRYRQVTQPAGHSTGEKRQQNPYDARSSFGCPPCYAAAAPGRTADFEALLNWVDVSTKDSCGNHYRSSRTSWIEALKAGDDLFDYSTLREMRVKPAVPGGEPC